MVICFAWAVKRQICSLSKRFCEEANKRVDILNSAHYDIQSQQISYQNSKGALDAISEMFRAQRSRFRFEKVFAAPGLCKVTNAGGHLLAPRLARTTLHGLSTCERVTVVTRRSSPGRELMDQAQPIRATVMSCGFGSLELPRLVLKSGE